jgi:hypothetical protein
MRKREPLCVLVTRRDAGRAAGVGVLYLHYATARGATLATRLINIRPTRPAQTPAPAPQTRTLPGASCRNPKGLLVHFRRSPN